MVLVGPPAPQRSFSRVFCYGNLGFLSQLSPELLERGLARGKQNDVRLFRKASSKACPPDDRRVAELESELAAARQSIIELEAELEVIRPQVAEGVAEAGLKQANALLESQHRNTASGILIVDRSGEVVSVNRRFLELWDIPEDFATCKSDRQLLDYVQAQVLDWANFFELVQHLYAHPEEEREGDVVELKSGRILSRNTRPVGLVDGTIIGRAWDFVDVTEMHRSEARLRQVIDLVPHFIFARDARGRFILVNQAVAELYGTTVEELTGNTDADIAPPDATVRYFGADDLEVIRSGRPKEILENRITDATGKTRILHTVKIPFTSANSDLPSILGVAIDVTDRKRSEDEHRALTARVQHTQKLESLGVLAGGIAHDFNNYLVGILGHAGLALNRLSPDAPSRRFIESVEAAAKRAAGLANQMLAYSGKGDFVVRCFDLNALAEDLGSLLDASISKKAEMRFDLAADLPPIEADATQIRQVAMNLITNASDALGETDGVITIRTGVRQVDRAYLSTTYLDDRLPEGRYVFLEVSDTGCGMDEETMSRMFDPFFTTKTSGRGLGMAALLGIVRGHNGAIRVSSEPGSGTSIRVLIPASECDEMPEPEPPATEAEDRWHGSGKVLVVDDEPVAREVAQATLESAGFEVLLAANGLDALEVVRRQGEKIAAVLLDLSMPQLDGAETSREMRRLCPEIRIILCTGYSEQTADELVAGRDVSGFLHKPYSPSSLIDVLREVVAG